MIRTALFKRSIATQASPKPVITKLSNGIIVATKPNTSSSTSSVGLVFGSGASSENPYNNGVSKLLSNIFIKDDLKATQAGFVLNSTVGKEFQSFIVSSSSSNVSKSLEYLQSKLANPVGSESKFSETLAFTLQETKAFEETKHAERVIEHLHSTAFQNTPLSLPTVGTVESLEGLAASDVTSFSESQFVASNAVIVGSGNVNHDELVKATESVLSLSSKAKVSPTKKSTFLGSEIRLRDDTLPKAYISIAAEGEPVSSPNYYVAQVAAKVFGSFISSEPASRLQGIKLLDDIQEYHLADTFNHFSYSYKEAGLWGFETTTSNVGQIDDLVHFTLKQWNRLSISITDTEVARGKSLLKLALASASTSDAVIATTLGSKLLAGAKTDLAEEFAKIDAVTAKDIKAWASERLWDQDIAIAGTGQIEDLFDYNRIRNDMSMMRW
ncbi:probable Cytochrome b-c1 complex subunit 1, mitochondrial [Saccharomycodes ludwigii]|uniref:Probable Cytochrome b-c1 complex subunit 1, mitochondrial n=1 Tax=Saccharomycodes ludwigii TaxID=36035 RepID=A0A376B9C2_9ASCO|nr:hypothetical protein SCDLUD_000076 [Saccharomycodes ludwigii]KAH3902499.1 hypothetical protein SCDLUD_000076 [Saccharomycodes ludwigii]SSD61134.1 probable Cytochrome b-c1 complex subunit 1, mitochondrial [Saccharomycodes ludwigii]